MAVGLFARGSASNWLTGAVKHGATRANAVAAWARNASGGWTKVWPLVAFQNGSKSFGSGSGSANALVQYLNTGVAQAKEGLGTTAYYNDYTWLLGGSAADYEIYATRSNTQVNSGAYLTWLPMSANRIFGMTYTASGSYSGSVTFQVRKVGTTVVLQTWTVSFQVDR